MKVFLYDGTFDGYLTAIFYAYIEKGEIHIYKEACYSPCLLTEENKVTTEDDKADRVFTSIQTKLSFSTLDKLYHLHLSCKEEADTLGLHYLKLCYRFSDSVNLAKNNDIVRQVDLINKQVLGEVHRFYGFVRFKEIAPMVFYSAVEPDNNILPLMMSHFKSRFSDQHFIIHDLSRHCAMIYDTKTIRLEYFSAEESKALSRAEITDPFEKYFKTYFQAVTIQSRLNPRQQNAYMPKRYYKHLVEL